jgi:D-serine deaminase-like pyridoxal phosphate-dependent protein
VNHIDKVLAMNPHTTAELALLETPVLLLDEARMARNIDRMQRRLDSLHVAFRPHVKTSKCPEVVRRQIAAGARGITVSTLKEADQFFAMGVTDILYAVAIAPTKFDHAMRLRQAGCSLTLVVESVQAAKALTEHGITHKHRHDVLIEIDTDGHRSGLKPDDAELLAVAAALRIESDVGVVLKGVMTHAGASYGCDTQEALVRMAEQERSGCVTAADRLRAAGFGCEVVSVGSTPTALSAQHLEGVTEVRAGVYVFFDLVMAGVGVCTADDIAVSVLATVIGHRRDTSWIITDAGWMALSRDRGTQKQSTDLGYGLVCDVGGRPLKDVAFASANQEHGVLEWHGDASVDLTARFPVGAQLRIYPNHACATAAQHLAYTVLPAAGGALGRWERFNGW